MLSGPLLNTQGPARRRITCNLFLIFRITSLSLAGVVKKDRTLYRHIDDRLAYLVLKGQLEGFFSCVIVFIPCLNEVDDTF